MIAEIISVGTELLLGQITNTNACFLAKELSEVGVDSFFQTTVGDNTDRIHQALEIATNRSDLIIFTGGLGPTPDDLTHEAISSFFKRKLVKDKKVLKQIQKKLKLRGYKNIPKINFKQAYKPKGAKWIPNKIGTANGIILKIRGESREVRGENKNNHTSHLTPHTSTTIITLPGVPSELKEMWSNYVKPYLKKIAGSSIIHSRTLKYTGIGESALVSKIKKYLYLKNPTVAPYAYPGEVQIRITTKEKSRSKAEKIINSIAKEILFKTKKYYFGKNNETLEELVARKLITRKKTLAIAESCTGGLLSKRLTDISGSSKYIKLNVVTYSNEAKQKILEVSKETLRKHGAVSSQVAVSMALGIKNLAKTNIGISITGICGPTGGTKYKPVGLVHFGLVHGNKVKTKRVLFSPNSTREDIRWLATQYALNWLQKELN